ncbi:MULTISPECIES: TetR/AcrR family transcriptional regulator [unclassified Streptomyces]|uniref:TetR family transcriptional regulator n=1 Tax=Streptomyces evansiae TaxID=3075535 RepID=A0ABU2R8K3_9ACTN|nr:MULTISPECIES: TetR/AcrR family transcriptional regulator [unclassified Streptomyces]MDT0412960.1 TetR family transcriptional regulator [Streptomyces sp. DSM 41979]MYQ57419.1 TetR family transcriptional regulator [Streptomyces sp. SID4926]SCE59853.1 transcriptional regulator, TetR family [Streptomyces sp. DfronAA-171]
MPENPHLPADPASPPPDPAPQADAPAPPPDAPASRAGSPASPAEPERPLSPAGRRVVAAAEELFYAHGITAVGVDLIAERSGVTKRTLYNQFGSKDRLVAAYLAARDARWRALVRAEVDAVRGRDPVAAVTAPFTALREWSRADAARGCAFINALAELPDPAHPAHRVAAGQKLWLRALFAHLATEAGCRAPDALATRLLVLHEGALATQPLPLDTLAETTALAGELVRAAAR